jgi:hypothetical protein
VDVVALLKIREVLRNSQTQAMWTCDNPMLD